jgi:hypothetical protein
MIDEASTVSTEQPATVETAEYKRPAWMTDTDWNNAIDKLGDLWFTLLEQAARG